LEVQKTDDVICSVREELLNVFPFNVDIEDAGSAIALTGVGTCSGRRYAYVDGTAVTLLQGRQIRVGLYCFLVIV